MADGIHDVLVRLCNQLDHGDATDLRHGLGAELTNLLSLHTLSTAFSVDGSPPTAENPGIDYPAVETSFKCLAKNEKVSRLVSEIIHQHIATLGQRLQETPEDIALLRTIPIVLQCTVSLRPGEVWCRKILVTLAQTLLHLKENCQPQFQVIERWFGNDQVLLKKAVIIFHGGLRGLMRSRAYKEIGTIDTYLAVLATLNKINEEHGCRVSRRLFCINGLEEDPELDRHFIIHAILKTHDQNAAPLPKLFTWLMVPFLLNVRTKWKFLSMEARFIQVGQAAKTEFENLVRLQLNMSFFASCFPQVPLVSTILSFDVDRHNIIQSAIENVEKYWQESDEPNLVWLKPLEVNFKGECAQDLGGPSKDFFHHLFIALMNPSLKFFKAFDEKSVSSDVWFNPENTDFRALEQIGLLFALLIFNGAIVTVPFPVQLYEKLLSNRNPTPSDLMEMDLEFVKGLFSLREETADGLEAMDLDFEGLHQGGEHECVDKENLEQFIDERINSRLALFHLQVFAKGFNRLASMTPLMRALFKAGDLRDVILGEELDWKEFRRNAFYPEPPYCEDHPVIQMFWKVFHELDERDKRKFLRFLTGADHVPLRGFVPFPVRRLNNMGQKYQDPYHPTNYPDPDDLMPEVMTCRGYLSMDLPEYTNEEVLRFRLLMAIDVKGFHREAPH